MRKSTSYGMFVALLCVLVFGIYFNILDNSPTNWDDPALFSRQAIQGVSLENLADVLSVSTRSTFQPVRDLSYMIDFALWGEHIVLGMHLHSILLYLLMVIACWIFLLELFRAFVHDEALSFTWAGLSTVIFAVHPVHVEAVAWLYARKEPLLGIFTFLSLWAFMKARAGKGWCYLLSVVLLLLAVLSKPTALVVPAVMVMLDIALQARQKDTTFWRRRAFIYIPMLIIVVPMTVWLLTMMISIGGVKPYHGGSFWTNLLAVSQIFISYISLIGFTINFSADYPIVLHADPISWQAWVFVALNVILIVSAIAAFLKKHYLYAVFVAWYYIFLLPVSHLFPISQTMADRYALLPSLSWCVFLGYPLARLWHWRLEHSRFSREFPMLVAIALFSVIVLAYAFMTVRQNDIWQNAQTLWEDTLAKYPNSSPANVNLSAIYLEQGRYEEVQKLCLTAIKEVPYDYLAISNLALAQMMMGQYDHAIFNYQQALKLKPDLTKAEMGLASAYWGAGDHEQAYQVYLELLRSNKLGSPVHQAVSYYRLGYMSWKLGDFVQARTFLNKAEEYAGNNQQLLTDLGGVYTSMGNISKAIEIYGRLYPLLEDDDLKEKLEDLLEALSKKLSAQRTMSSE
ncbi:MAG: tetratricopeptide repeat protein [Desulfomonilia bacterium]